MQISARDTLPPSNAVSEIHVPMMIQDNPSFSEIHARTCIDSR